MDELGRSFPAAEGFVDAEEFAKGKHPNEFCLNCETKLEDTFCHHCGQKDLPQRQTLGELLQNFISSFWSYEGKFFTTTKYLLIRPGFLATEYTAGRRERYYHPARMYVFISFVFFLLFASLTDIDLSQRPRSVMTMDKEDFQELKNDFKKFNVNEDTLFSRVASWNSDSSEVKISRAAVDSIRRLLKKKSASKMITMDKEDFEDFRNDFKNSKVNVDSFLSATAAWNPDSSEVKIPRAAVDSIRKLSRKNTQKNSGGKNNFNFSLNNTEYKTIEAYDSVQNALPESERDNWIERSLEKRTIELNERYKDDVKKMGLDFMKMFMDNFSKVLFWLLPIFALLLKMLYARRDFYYSEHLVFTIYYYNFFYLAGSLQMLVNRVPWLTWAGDLMAFWIFFYLLFAMKRMYNQRWGKTIFKFLSFSFLFAICLLIGITISGFAILMFI
jgi:hypothetical protein